MIDSYEITSRDGHATATVYASALDRIAYADVTDRGDDVVREMLLGEDAATVAGLLAPRFAVPETVVVAVNAQIAQFRQRQQTLTAAAFALPVQLDAATLFRG